MSPRSDLAGKTALVTGGAKRIGKAVALALAKRGVHVAIHYHASAEEADMTASQVRAEGVRAWAFSANLEDAEQADTLTSRVVETAGPIDILVNNASIFSESRVTDLSPEVLHQNVTVNALAPLLIARRFAAQGREGSLVNFLDCRIADYDREHAAYHLSKRMLFTLTRMMAVEFAPAIRVNAVAPGLILPPAGKDESYSQSLAPTNPLGKAGNLGDVVAAVLFLLESGFITGQVIYVDGGRHLRGAMYG